MQAGTLFQVMNGSGEELFSYTPECSYSSVAFSAPALTIGETYTIIYGESSAELTIDSPAMSIGNSGGMGGMQSGGMNRIQPGGMGNMRLGDTDSTDSELSSDQKGESDSERPTLPDGEMGNPPQQNDNSNYAHPGHSDSESGSTDGTTEIYPDTEFTITGKLLGPNGQPYTWQEGDDVNASGAYHKYDKDGNRIVYKGHFPDSSNITFTLKAGERIRQRRL